jgi:hypothetical protein
VSAVQFLFLPFFTGIFPKPRSRYKQGMTKTKKKKPDRRWVFWVAAIPLAGCALLLMFTLTVLNRAGENMRPDDIIDRLAMTNGVYGPALSPKILPFKSRLYERYTPDTVLLGSARADQLRAEDFSVPFVNLSGAETLDELQALSAYLFERMKPKAVILALDDWWFLDDGKAAVTLRAPEAEKTRANDLFTLAAWYATGDLTPGDVRTILSGASPNIGFDGILRGDGFDRGGAYSYASLLQGRQKSKDEVFAKSLDDVAHGASIFGWGDHVDTAQWQKLNGLLEFYAQRGIKTFIVFPPFAPTVLDTMSSSNKYGYVDGLRMKVSEMAAAYHMPLFDDHDLRFAGAVDCEFIDGAHPGAIAAKRMLLDMAVKDPDMRARLKLPELGWSIEHFKGRASALPVEADFLKLGCAKTAAPAAPPHG